MIDSLSAYGEANGHYPSDLHVLFPSGLPEGLIAVNDMADEEYVTFFGQPRGLKDVKYYANDYVMRNSHGEFTQFSYGSASDPNLLSNADRASGAYKGHYFLIFRYTPPGINTCTWTTKERKWTCGGYM